MKHLKKLLALALAFLLALGVSAPAMALEEDTFRVITPEYQEIPLPFGSDIALSVEVHLPEGWTVEYQWSGDIKSYGPTGDWHSVGQLYGQTEATLRLSPGESHYPQAKTPYVATPTAYFYCGMTVRDEEGTLIKDGNSDFFRVFAVTIEAKRSKNLLDAIGEFLASAANFVLAGLFAIFVLPIVSLFF